MEIMLDDHFVLQQMEVACESVQALTFPRACVDLCTPGSALASYTRTRGRLCTPYHGVWISIVPRLETSLHTYSS